MIIQPHDIHSQTGVTNLWPVTHSWPPLLPTSTLHLQGSGGFLPPTSPLRPYLHRHPTPMPTEGAHILLPTIGIPAGLRYKHYLYLSPYGRNVASRQAGMKNSDQARNDNLLSLLQQSRENAIHTWTFIWGNQWPIRPFCR